MLKKPNVIIYTDGACKGNPGVGGWGVLLKYKNKTKKLYGGEKNTTNNQMELTAAIEALKCLKQSSLVDLYTDSTYVKNGILQWIHNWKKNNWKTAQKKPVKNKELWLELDHQLQKHQVRWHWVKGHAGIEGNEIADQLANLGVESLRL
ncbi:ribonuclease HI [Thiotrichales bacterium 19S3-7]|nr:ribonuclease HI [Thiotrichales bacterium 19S3-7]MCF6801089.1 ribonuclease HI [Thiotrichales bacterium 19S3-11]